MDYTDITKVEQCPVCEVSWIHSYIPQESIDKGYYSPESKFFSRVIGVEYLGTDRINHYQCPDCGQCWNRKGEIIEVKHKPVDLSSLR